MSGRYAPCFAIVLGVGFLLALAGCGSNNKDKIEGTKWVSQKHEKDGRVVPARTISVEFKEDGGFEWKVSTKSGVTTIKGKYTLGAGDSVTLNLDEEFEGQKTHTEKIAIRDKAMTLSDKKDKIYFDRAD